MNAKFDTALPIYAQIVERLKSAIAKGEMKPGEKIPAVRDLAAACKVNPNTMQRALAKLEDEGYFYSERTSGRYVTQDLKKIAQLQDDLPASLTKAYIAAMENAGIEAMGLPAYVMSYLVRNTAPQPIPREDEEEEDGTGK